MKRTKVIQDVIGLYVLIPPPVLGDGPFEGRIIGKDGGFYIVQQFGRGATEDNIAWCGISLMPPGDLYAKGATLHRTPEDLETATLNYWREVDRDNEKPIRTNIWA